MTALEVKHELANQAKNVLEKYLALAIGDEIVQAVVTIEDNNVKVNILSNFEIIFSFDNDNTASIVIIVGNNYDIEAQFIQFSSIDVLDTILVGYVTKFAQSVLSSHELIENVIKNTIIYNLYKYDFNAEFDYISVRSIDAVKITVDVNEKQYEYEHWFKGSFVEGDKERDHLYKSVDEFAKDIVRGVEKDLEWKERLAGLRE